MTVRAPVPAAGNVAEDFRLGLNGLVAPAAGGGVLFKPSMGGCGVSAQSPAAMAVNVASGAALVAGTVSATQGAYLMYNDGVVAVSIAAADSVNSRIDLVGLHVNDPVYDPADPNPSGIVYVEGVPASPPVAPTVPESTLVLAQITVPANATTVTASDIADQRTLTGPVTPGKVGGRMYQNSEDILNSGSVGQLSNMVDDYAYGGVSFVGASNGLQVPVTGLYQVSWQITWDVSNNPPPAGNYSAYVYVNGARRRANNVYVNGEFAGTVAAQGVYPTPGGCDTIQLNGGDELTLWGIQNIPASEGNGVATYPGTLNTWLSVVLVGV